MKLEAHAVLPLLRPVPSTQDTSAICWRRQLQLRYDDVGDEVLAAALAHMPCLQVDAVIHSCLWLRHPCRQCDSIVVGEAVQLAKHYVMRVAAA
jgi:hypothetical protein